MFWAPGVEVRRRREKWSGISVERLRQEDATNQPGLHIETLWLKTTMEEEDVGSWGDFLNMLCFWAHVTDRGRLASSL